MNPYLTHSCTSLSEWNRRPWMSFFRSLKLWKSQGEKDVGCTEEIEKFPRKISAAYPSPYWQYGDGHYHAKEILRPTVFQGVLTLWRVAVSATCLHSASHWLWLHAVGSRQAVPAVEEEGQHDFTGTLMGSFGFLRRGRIDVIPLLALPFISRAQNGGTTFRPLWRYVIGTHTLPHVTAANDWHAPSCQSFVPPSVDAEPTARKFFGTAGDLW